MGLVAQTDSRIANGSRAWQAACNVDITDWDKSDSFILSTWAYSNSVNPDDNCKLYWRRVGGTFAEVSATSEICWKSDTVLVNGSSSSSGESAGCLSPWDSCVENEGDNVAYMTNIENTYYGEIQWALGFGSGALDNQEYEVKHHLYQTWDSEAICQTTITTAVAGGTIDTANKRRSVCSLPWDPTYPEPDGSITMLDQVQQVGYYAGILPASSEGNPYWYYKLLKSRN